MARLIKSEKEVEGRYEEVWTLVEEDALDQWPAGPGDVVGRDATRLDGLVKARGEARYTADIRLPGMLQAALLRSPYAHARVARIDLTRAAAAPGVLGVVGPGEVWGVSEEIGFEGSAVAAVAAETEAQARAAVELIDVDWEELEPLLDADEAVARGSLVAETRRYERGDLEQGLAQADAVVESEYRTQTLNHNPLETHGCVCEWRGDAIDVYISTQYIWGLRRDLAENLGLPADKVRVVCEFMGGGFGAKNGLGNYVVLAAELAKRTKRPVRCALGRREENVVGGNRNATKQRVTAAARSDGTLTALAGEFTCALGWEGWLPPTAGPTQLLYACDNVRTVEHGAKLNLPPMAAFRAPGFVEGTWSLECVLDKLAAALDLDPLELRKHNYAHSDPMDGRPFSSKNLMECYRRAEPHWARRHEVRARSDEVWKRGMGLASQSWYGGGGPPSYAWVRLGSDGRANVVTAMQDIGTGTRTAMAQIAAEELGLLLEQVEVQIGDSARGPFASISGGSSTLPSMGPAVRSAAADAARQVLELAAQRFDREQRLLSLKGGRIVSSDGGSWPIDEITGLLDDGQILGKGARGPNPTGMRVLTFGIQLAEVAVDVGTGEVVVERVIAIHDVGRVINPLGARSQVEGGIIQALGHTFSEHRLDDPETGAVLTKTLDAYKLPTIADVPEIVCDFVDEPDAHLTNLGSKGLGEPPIVPTAAAIANAIRDATGADVTSLPITREEILRALREAAERRREPVAAGTP
ncbi:MAG: xanthine dehydrogenase family protein molybdopterin-binding subunit [Actinobacteria bacterium]|nr:xanthine dehydrogenase family protein molybdopterin-binding subunit [Actinomycetota bacterium]MDQ3162333.1 xanthine dehydrogenase family protein molybdopterin-binding subunit [Actinomycetota bacterium]